MAYCFFDIDGTLADEGVQVVGALENLKALRECGHMVFICTGRPYVYADEIFHDVVNGYVASNGRYLHYHGECIFEYPMTMEEIQNVHEQAYQCNAITIFQGLHHRYILKRDEDCYHQWLHKKALPEVSILDHQTIYNFNLYYHDQEAFTTLCHLWKHTIILNDHHNNVSADASIIGFDKGDGISHMLKHIGGTKEEAYAFGDGNNDIAMFRACGQRIAMGNALMALKQEATYITDHFQNRGVEKALHHYGLLK